MDETLQNALVSAEKVDDEAKAAARNAVQKIMDDHRTLEIEAVEYVGEGRVRVEVEGPGLRKEINESEYFEGVETEFVGTFTVIVDAA